MKPSLAVLSLVLSVSMFASSANADLIINLQETGGNVIMSWGGQLDLSGLTTAGGTDSRPELTWPPSNPCSADCRCA